MTNLIELENVTALEYDDEADIVILSNELYLGDSVEAIAKTTVNFEEVIAEFIDGFCQKDVCGYQDRDYVLKSLEKMRHIIEVRLRQVEKIDVLVD